ncbi:MAG TPA: 4Fe-4S binding protein, partial [Actinotalea sp.]|nr:4Fe-4S binding protein [Actinotalea sp.]
LFPLLAEGGSVYSIVARVFGSTADGDTALVGTGTIQILQFALLGLGIAASLYTARRIAHRRYRTEVRRRATLVPYVAVIAILGAVNVWMFLLPMAHRV